MYLQDCGLFADVVIAMRQLLPNVAWHKVIKEQLQNTILQMFNDYYLHLSTKSVTDLHTLLYTLHLQCPPEYSHSILFSIVFEFYYGMHLFSLLQLPPAELPNVCYAEPCHLEYHDLFDNNISFPSQILNSHDICHSLNNLHPSCKPDIPWEFNEVYRCIIDNFHEPVMQIKYYDRPSLIQLPMCYAPCSLAFSNSQKVLIDYILQH